MLTSKLSHYVNIAKLLLEDGPMTFNQLNFLLKNPNKVSLKRDLDFLAANKLITKQPSDHVAQYYEIAPSGINVLKFFNLVPSKEKIKTIS